MLTWDALKVNRNKKSLGLSFQHEEGIKILHELAKTSDVLVENYIPGEFVLDVRMHC
jgi:succinate---hydroxymethylglutarate CoA-transferase